MTVHYKVNGRDVSVKGVSWVDTFVVKDGKSTAVFCKDRYEVEIPLEDLVSITEH